MSDVVMRCVVCQREQVATAGACSRWVWMFVSGRVYFACPDEYPPEWANADDQTRAVQRVDRAVQEAEKARAAAG